MRQLYIEEVEYTDGVLGDFYGVRDVVNRPISIIFTSDHGEMLGEHDIHFNHHGLYDEVLRVPDHRAAQKKDTWSSGFLLRFDFGHPHIVMGLLGVDEWDDVESGNLMDHAHGLQDRDFSGFLMGRTGRSSMKAHCLGIGSNKAMKKPAKC